MRFLWDPEKARRNIEKHRVSFDTARAVWDDRLHVIVPDRIEDGEQRWHAVGAINSVVILVVVHTYPDDDERVVRIIGARRAAPHERKRYEEDSA